MSLSTMLSVANDSDTGKRATKKGRTETERSQASLIDQLHYMATRLNCYKTILNCTPHNVPFYEKCQLRQTHVQMTRYFDREEE